jgi:hypothetical protein
MGFVDLQLTGPPTGTSARSEANPPEAYRPVPSNECIGLAGRKLDVCFARQRKKSDAPLGRVTDFEHSQCFRDSFGKSNTMSSGPDLSVGNSYAYFKICMSLRGRSKIVSFGFSGHVRGIRNATIRVRSTSNYTGRCGRLRNRYHATLRYPLGCFRSNDEFGLEGNTDGTES